MTLTVDVPEVRAFVGMSDGTIKSFSLLEPPRNLNHHYEESEKNTVFSGHTKTITCLALSVDDTILVSGSADETIRLWYVNSKQLVRTIRLKGIILNLLVRMLPELLQVSEVQPSTVIRSFQKRYDGDQTTQTLEIICPIDNYVERLNENGTENRDDELTLNDQIDELRQINRELFDYAKTKILEKNNIC